ncbi:MAG: 50S ribosomal protein L28 [Candidatus Omnitrophica bacterium]|nr:50S ribosomal protein L28 [Candidatus Omnitrophota bacterium]MCA9415846.1 50S ribosomal protein L28 [Candidatus Omnitrophota bacterium]MCA9426712.1 50S ribosomal protein L28 [Candidatus Omnitrophota bacterium]MCA9432591.1 50S ribosomal protein L28 [Candidatus Omnitrophota bacterium]MCA9434166.1 50S ribosomal protein L28 [Candidatus Omnitrophota bacterium]
MPRVCKLSGKKVRSGHNVSHAHNVTKRKFKPNLQKKTLLVNGKKVKVMVSTRALRSLSKGKTKNLNLDL